MKRLYVITDLDAGGKVVTFNNTPLIYTNYKLANKAVDYLRKLSILNRGYAISIYKPNPPYRWERKEQ